MRPTSLCVYRCAKPTDPRVVLTSANDYAPIVNRWRVHNVVKNEEGTRAEDNQKMTRGCAALRAC